VHVDLRLLNKRESVTAFHGSYNNRDELRDASADLRRKDVRSHAGIEKESTDRLVDVAARKVFRICGTLEELLHDDLATCFKAPEPGVGALDERDPVGKE
jgi:hypothetical protein